MRLHSNTIEFFFSYCHFLKFTKEIPSHEMQDYDICLLNLSSLEYSNETLLFPQFLIRCFLVKQFGK